MDEETRLLLFEKKLNEEQRKGRIQRLEHAPPIGFLPDGTLNVVRPEDLERSRKWKPKIIPDPADAEIRDLGRVLINPNDLVGRGPRG
jgi:hypothetical protein